jgi:hypothetical protein
VTTANRSGRVVERNHREWMLVRHPDGGEAYTEIYLDGNVLAGIGL